MFLIWKRFGTMIANKNARLTEGLSTMRILLQSEVLLNLVSHQAVGWTLVKVYSLCGYIRVFI